MNPLPSANVRENRPKVATGAANAFHWRNPPVICLSVRCLHGEVRGRLSGECHEQQHPHHVGRAGRRLAGAVGRVARVQFLLEPHTEGTRVTIGEDVESGPGRLVPKPLRDVQLAWRNVETLRRLAYIAERRP